MTGLRILVLIALSALGCGGFESYEPVSPTGRASDHNQAGAQVFISVSAFETARAGGASVLDARKQEAYSDGHIPGAAHAPWERFVEGDQSGLLSGDTTQLEAELSLIGLRADRPVLVYGRWDQDWGEEGRIFWMLEYFGHRNVKILQGGIDAYASAGHALSTGLPAIAPGDFTIKPRPELRATAAEVRASLDAGDAVILDIRTRAEYEGLTPHGSPRGGHVPQALHYEWREVFGDDGALLPKATVRDRLSALGIEEDTLVIAYCTGGIRSGFVYAIMRWAGYEHARNYDGSWWEWSAREELPVER